MNTRSSKYDPRPAFIFWGALLLVPTAIHFIVEAYLGSYNAQQFWFLVARHSLALLPLHVLLTQQQWPWRIFWTLCFFAFTYTASAMLLWLEFNVVHQWDFWQGPTVVTGHNYYLTFDGLAWLGLAFMIFIGDLLGGR
jgi:hypothetical protein